MSHDCGLFLQTYKILLFNNISLLHQIAESTSKQKSRPRLRAAIYISSIYNQAAVLFFVGAFFAGAAALGATAGALRAASFAAR